LEGVTQIQITNPTELAKLYISDESRNCSSEASMYNFHRFVFEIPSCVTHISMLHEGYGTGGHALFVWNGSAWEEPPVASTPLSGPPDRTLTGELTSGFSDYIQDGELNLLAIANNSTEVSIMCTDYVRVGITCPVGGEVLPIDKVSILAPWLGLAAFLAAAIAVVLFVKRRRVA
jgi:hypothetical protein